MKPKLLRTHIQVGETCLLWLAALDDESLLCLTYSDTLGCKTRETPVDCRRQRGLSKEVCPLIHVDLKPPAALKAPGCLSS